MDQKQIPLLERVRRAAWMGHRLVLANLICFLVFLPVMTWFYLVLNTYLHAGLESGMVDVLPGLGYYAGLLLRLPPVLFYVLLAVSAVLFGPFLFGLHAVTGAMVQGSHIWVSDLFLQARLNAKQGVFAGLFCVIGTHLLLWNIFGGIYSYVPWISMMIYVSRWVSVGLLAFLLMALPYFCQIGVSISLSTPALAKNAAILARVHLGRGLLLLFGIAVFWWGALSYFPLLGLLGLPFFVIGLTALAQAVACSPPIERYVLQPARERLDS